MKNKTFEKKSNFITGILDYRMLSKKIIMESIKNGFFNRIVKSIEVYSKEIAVIFTCLRLEIYIYNNNKKELNKIRDIFLRNKFKILFTEEEIINHLTQLCSGQLSEIIGELQIEKQVINTFESHLEEKAKLKRIYQISLTKAFSFRKDKNFYNTENYATITSKIMDDLVDGRIKGLLIVGAGTMSREFVKVCNSNKDKIDKIFITDINKEKSKILKNNLIIKNAEIINSQQINDIVKKVDTIFAAAAGNYKIYKHVNPLLIFDITCPPMFSVDQCPKTKIITMYDEIYKKKINQVNNIFKYKLKN